MRFDNSLALSLVFATSLSLLIIGCPTDDDGGGDVGFDLDASLDAASDPSVDTSRDTPVVDAPSDRADGPTTDSSVDFDAGAVSLTVETTSQWQRGVVSLTYVVDAPSGSSFAVEAAFTTQDPSSGTFLPATGLDGFGNGAGPVGAGRHRFVWDSFEDISGDASAVWVRVSISGGRGSATSPPAGPFPLLNDADRPRVVLMTSSINDNQQVRPLAWTNGDGLSYDGDVVTLAMSPDSASFDPGGRTAAVVGAYDDEVLFLTFDAEGGLDQDIVLLTPGLEFDSAAFSADGSTLYLLVFNPTDYGGGIYQVAIDPWTALPTDNAEVELLYPMFVPTSFALIPDRRGIIVHGTSRDDERGAVRMQWIDLDGTLVDDAYYAPLDSSAEFVAVSPDGRWALASYSNLFNGVGGVQLVEIEDTGDLTIAEENSFVELGWAGDIAFHESSTAALVTQIQPDRVISLIIGSGGTVSQVDSLVLGAADRIAHTRVGLDRNTFHVTTVHPRLSELGSGLGIFALDETGSVVASDPFYLGAGLEKIPSDVAIQP